MRAKLRHLSWKRNFVLALFEEDTFFLRLRSGEKRKEGKSDGVGERDFGKGGGEPKKTCTKRQARVRASCARPVFSCFCVHLFTFGLYFVEK